jgi:hypothetical protein
MKFKKSMINLEWNPKKSLFWFRETGFLSNSRILLSIKKLTKINEPAFNKRQI